MRNIKILGYPKTENMRGPDYGMRSLCDELDRVGWPDWLSISEIPDLRPKSIPLIWRWSSKNIINYYMKNNIDFILGINILFNDCINCLPIVNQSELEILHSKNLLGVITDGHGYADVIKYTCRNKLRVDKLSYPPTYNAGVVSADVDYLIYNKNKFDMHIFAGELEKRLSKIGTTKTVHYGEFNQKYYHGLLANTKTLIYLSSCDRYPVSVCEALAAGCRIIGCHNSCEPVYDIPFDKPFYKITHFPFAHDDIINDLAQMTEWTLQDKTDLAGTAKSVYDGWANEFINILEEYR